MSDTRPDNILEVNHLRTYFFTEEGVIKAVDDVGFSVGRGEVWGLVGESGCGKSVTARSIMGLIDPPGKVIDGSVRFDGVELLNLCESEVARIRGDRISMIFQQPQSSLNPIFQVGDQVAETLLIHRGIDKQAGWQQAIELLTTVGIPDPGERAHSYPHELSGGMAQRVMVATALACTPEVLIADEPTTALDVTIQAQILDLIRHLCAKTKTAVVLITHDLGVIAEMANRVAVMYAGQIVEEADVETLFTAPKHPYTLGLIRSTPVLGQVKDRLDVIPGSVACPVDLPPGCRFAPRCTFIKEHHLAACTQYDPRLDTVGPNHKVRCWLFHDSEAHKAPLSAGIDIEYFDLRKVPNQIVARRLDVHEATEARAYETKRELVKVEHLVKHFPVRGGLLQRTRAWVHAVEDVSLAIYYRETLGLVGESGCGKTTLARTMLRLIPATRGSVWFEGTNVYEADKRMLKSLRRHMQYVFQNPFASLNPRMRVGEIVEEGLLVHGMHDVNLRREIVIDTLHKVGMEEDCLRRYPYEFSGGQRQRIGLARVLALRPKFLVCDEPVSALDVSVQSQVLNLLRDLQKDFDLTYLFIAHNLSVVEHISDRVAVMYLGKIVELTDRDELYRNPLHPYTQALMSAIPIPDPTLKQERIILKGDVPSPLNPPSGCRFYTRCLLAKKHCGHQEPEFNEISSSHWVACWLVK